MKIVINDCYGGFDLSDEAMNILNCDEDVCYDEAFRTDEYLITLIEEKGSEFVSGGCANLVVVEIPNDATDWQIDEEDGYEGIIYVQNGKIYWI